MHREDEQLCGSSRVTAARARQIPVMGVGGPGEVHMMCGPLYHSQPIGFSTQALNAGHRVVMMQGGFDAEQCLAAIDAEKVTWLTCVPTHFVRIMALPFTPEKVYRALHAARKEAA